MGSKSKQYGVRQHIYKRLEKHCEYLELLLQAEKKKIEILKLIRPRPLLGKIKCRLGRHDLKTFLKAMKNVAARKVCKRCGDVFVMDYKLKWIKVEEENA